MVSDDRDNWWRWIFFDTHHMATPHLVLKANQIKMRHLFLFFFIVSLFLALGDSFRPTIAYNDHKEWAHGITITNGWVQQMITANEWMVNEWLVNDHKEWWTIPESNKWLQQMIRLLQSTMRPRSRGTLFMISIALFESRLLKRTVYAERLFHCVADILFVINLLLKLAPRVLLIDFPDWYKGLLEHNERSDLPEYHTDKGHLTAWALCSSYPSFLIVQLNDSDHNFDEYGMSWQPAQTTWFWPRWLLWTNDRNERTKGNPNVSRLMTISILSVDVM